MDLSAYDREGVETHANVKHSFRSMCQMLESEFVNPPGRNLTICLRCKQFQGNQKAPFLACISKTCSGFRIFAGNRSQRSIVAILALLPSAR